MIYGHLQGWGIVAALVFGGSGPILAAPSASPPAKCPWEGVYACSLCDKDKANHACWLYELRLRCHKEKIQVDADADGPQAMERLHGEAKVAAKELTVVFTRADDDDIRLSPLAKGATLGHLTKDAKGRITWRFGQWRPATPSAGPIACQAKAGYRRP